MWPLGDFHTGQCIACGKLFQQIFTLHWVLEKRFAVSLAGSRRLIIAFPEGIPNVTILVHQEAQELDLINVFQQGDFHCRYEF